MYFYITTETYEIKTASQIDFKVYLFIFWIKAVKSV